MEFVNFEIAKKLKEKGYPQVEKNTIAMYSGYGEWFSLAKNLDDFEYSFVDFDEYDYVCPTISQALDWLGVEKQIYILVEPFPSMATKDKVCWSWSFKWNSDGINIDHTFPDTDGFVYLTSKEAALAGIEYILDNLIVTQEDKERECKKCGRVFGSARCFDVDCPNNTPNY